MQYEVRRRVQMKWKDGCPAAVGRTGALPLSRVSSRKHFLV